MTEKSSSQSQKKHAYAGAPGAEWFGLDAWRKAADESLDRMSSLLETAGRFQTQGVEQTSRAIDEGAKLMAESLQNTARVSAEWRKMAVDATRRMAEMMRQTV